MTGSLCSAWPSIPVPTKRSGNYRVFKDDHVFWLSLVLAPTPPIPKFFPFGIYEALPVLAKRAAVMGPITNDSKMALSSLPILASGANYNEYEHNTKVSFVIEIK